MTHLHYPKRNIVGLNPVWAVRQITKIEIIDLVQKPLPISDYLRRPLIRRGRWLMKAFDIDQRRYRQFYMNAFRHDFREPPLRIGIVENGKISAIDRAYLATVDDRRALAMVLHRLKHHDNIYVFADDLSIVRAAS